MKRKTSNRLENKKVFRLNHAPKNPTLTIQGLFNPKNSVQTFWTLKAKIDVSVYAENGEKRA